MSGSVRSRMPLRLLLSSITGWRTTTPCIPIPGWAIAHLGSTSFPNPLRVRFDGVNAGDTILGDAVDAKAAVFGEHVDREVVQPAFVLAEQVGDVVDREDGADGHHGQAAWVCGAKRGCQFHGRRSSILWAGCSAMRARTSASQACGSMLFNLAVTIRLYIAAARCPPRSEPANNHDFRPRAMPRNARSAALFDRQIRPSSRKRVKAGQRFSR